MSGRPVYEDLIDDENSKIHLFHKIISEGVEHKIPDIRAYARIATDAANTKNVSEVDGLGIIKETQSYYLFRHTEHVEVWNTLLEKRRQMFITKNEKNEDNLYLELGFSKDISESTNAYIEVIDTKRLLRAEQETLLIGGESNNSRENLVIMGDNDAAYSFYVYKQEGEKESVGLLHVADGFEEIDHNIIEDEFKKAYEKEGEISRSFYKILDYLKYSYGSDYIFIVNPKMSEFRGIVNNSNEPVFGSMKRVKPSKRVIYQNDNFLMSAPLLQRIIKGGDDSASIAMKVTYSNIEPVLYDRGLSNQDYKTALKGYA